MLFLYFSLLLFYIFQDSKKKDIEEWTVAKWGSKVAELSSKTIGMLKKKIPNQSTCLILLQGMWNLWSIMALRLLHLLQTWTIIRSFGRAPSTATQCLAGLGRKLQKLLSFILKLFRSRTLLQPIISLEEYPNLFETSHRIWFSLKRYRNFQYREIIGWSCWVNRTHFPTWSENPQNIVFKFYLLDVITIGNSNKKKYNYQGDQVISE